MRSASITYMIRHYVARRAQVIEDHPHNAADDGSSVADLARDMAHVRVVGRQPRTLLAEGGDGQASLSRRAI